jgi:hypothetical protein
MAQDMVGSKSCLWSDLLLRHHQERKFATQGFQIEHPKAPSSSDRQLDCISGSPLCQEAVISFHEPKNIKIPSLKLKNSFHLYDKIC